MKAFLFLTSFFVFFASQSLACSCPTPKKIRKQDYENANAVFIGKVISIKENENLVRKEIVFEVIKQLKKGVEMQSITVYTASSSSACGLPIDKVGEEWYIFAYLSDENLLRTGLCGRSIKLKQKFRIKDLGLKYAFIEKWYYHKEITRFRQDKRFIKKMNRRV